MALHISLSAEPIIHLGSLPITNSMLASWIVVAILLALAFYAKATFKPTKKPTGLQNIMEIVIGALYGLTSDICHDSKKTNAIFPFAATFFLYIILNNWLGLLPGFGTIGILENESTSTEVHASSIVTPAKATETEAIEVKELETNEANHESSLEEATSKPETEKSKSSHGPKFVPILRAGTADLNTTLALSIISMLFVQIFGVKFQGLKYFSKFLNLKQGPIMFYVGILETVSEFSKVISFTFRLFGNIFAGEVLLAVIAFLVPIFMPIPFLGLEIFVGFIQALVFTMLSIVFMSMATIGHDSEH